MGYAAAAGAVVGVGASLLGYFLTDKNTPSYDQKSAKSDLNSYMNNVLPLYQNLSYNSVDVAKEGQKAVDFNLKNLGNYESSASSMNAAAVQDRMKMLETVSPGFTEQRDLADTDNTALLKGEIPMDVQQQMARSNAFKTYSAGYSGSPTARSGTLARDLGLTSLGLQQLGSTNAQNWLKTENQVAMPTQTYANQIQQETGMTAGLAVNTATANSQGQLNAAEQAAAGEATAYQNKLSTQLNLLSQKLADQQSSLNAKNSATSALVSGIGNSLSKGIGGVMGAMGSGGSSGIGNYGNTGNTAQGY